MEQLFSPIILKHDAISYIAPSWQQLQAAIFALSQEIKQKNQHEKPFDVIVAIASGSFPYAVMLQDFLEVDELLSIGIQTYSGINETGDARFFQEISENIDGKKVLLFDDVTDSGKTMELALEYLETKGVTDVTTATLFHKPHSSYIPDYHVNQTTAWIIFPQDIWESMRILHIRWSEKKVNTTAMKAAFTALGFEKQFVEAFFTSVQTPTK